MKFSRYSSQNSVTALQFTCWTLLILLLLNQVTGNEPGNHDKVQPGFIHKPGYCLMYGECGENTNNGKKINCLYNGKAKKLTDPKGIALLKELCPYLYKGGNNSKTCCDTHQLSSLKANLQLPYQYLSRCPSCYRNFVALYCEMTCSPDQSRFTDVNKQEKGDDPSLNIHAYNPNSLYISELGYTINNQYANSMFNSCKHVFNPSTNTPAIKLLCGPYGESCTAQKWITYMNNIDNGLAPFQIDTVFTNESGKGQNYATDLCQNPTYLGEAACRCKYCPASCSVHPTMKPISPAQRRKKYFDEHFGPFYKTGQLNITAPFSKRTIYSPYTASTDPKDKQYIPFGPILQLDVLTEILELQNAVASITGEYNGEKVTLNDICFKPLAPDNNNCTIMSVLNYFQNSVTKLNEVVMLNEGFSRGPDYHDHLMACTSFPDSVDDHTRLHMSCLDTFSGPVPPWVALDGYDEQHFLNATVAVIAIPVENYYGDSTTWNKALAWESALLTYIKKYMEKGGNLNVAFSTEQSIKNENNRKSGFNIND